MLFFVSENLGDDGTNFYLVSVENQVEVRRMFDTDADIDITPDVEEWLNEQYGGFAALGTV